MTWRGSPFPSEGRRNESLMIQFLKSARLAGIGEACTPWRDWEVGLENSALISQTEVAGACDFWECTMEMEVEKGLAQVMTRPHMSSQPSLSAERVELPRQGRLRLRLRWSVHGYLSVSVALAPTVPKRSPGDQVNSIS